MASTQTFSEYNGAGATETTSRADCNWKNIDDSTTVYSSSVITAGNNSFGKYQAIKFGGTYNQLSLGTVKVSSNAPATGVSLVGTVTTTYVTPATTATGDGAFSTTGTGYNFGASPAAASSSTTASNPAYSGYVRSQLQTTTAAAPGDTPTITFTYQWTES